MKYDSISEQVTATQYEQLGFRRQTQFNMDCSFSDPKGEQFKALPDRYNETTDLYLDEKYAPLNHKTSRATAQRATANAKARFDAGLSKAKTPAFYQIKHGWNHSVVKQRAVQMVLGPDRYAPCFKQPIEPEDLTYYHSKGLRVCTLKSLPSYNAWAALSKAGIPCEFRLHSDDGKSLSFEQREQGSKPRAKRPKAGTPVSERS